MDAAKGRASLLKVIGPGLLLAGAAIGVSHLVQSTRAGAMFGLGLVGVVLLANLTKKTRLWHKRCKQSSCADNPVHGCFAA